MSRRERALTALHRLRDFQHGRQEAAHRLARRDEHAQLEALQRARSELQEGHQQAGSAGQGGNLDLGRAAQVAQLMQGLLKNVRRQRDAHEQARERTTLAAAQHLAAQRQRDQVGDHVARERARLQQASDVRDYDDRSDLLLARRLDGGAA
jgi:hypothetical protein